MGMTGRRLRADAERSVRTILEAAERLLGENPGATMEQIAEAAGVARTTVHRRFASREALIETMTVSAWQEIDEAVDAARPYTAPPLVAMHQATANVLQIKSSWRFALSTALQPGGQAARVHDEVMLKCDAVFARAREAGLLRPGTDLLWARQVYLALIGEAAHGSPTAPAPSPGARPRGEHQRQPPPEPEPEPEPGPSSAPGAGPETGDDPDALAARIIDTLLYGLAPR